MASAFNLTAQLNLRGPTNVNQIANRIRQQLGSVNVNVGVAITQGATQNVAALNSALQALNNTLGQTTSAAAGASTALNNLISAGNNLSNLNIGQQLNTASTAAQQLATNTAAAAQATVQARTQMEEFGRQSALAVRRFAAFSFVTSSIFAVTNAINQGVRAFIDYDRQLVKLQQITGESREGLQKLSNQIGSLSRSLGVSSSELINVSSTLAQAGLSARDTEKALKALALSALAPSFDNLNKTVEGSIALMRQFGISAGELEKSLGAVNAVAARFAVESGDIIAAIQRTGGVFASASRGVSEGTDALNEFIAVFTSVRATTRESAETIATGLRTIFTRIQRGSTIEALKEFGVTLTDAEGKFVGAYKAIELLSKGLSNIDPRDIKFSDIVEELGGFRQIGKVIPLIQQFSTAQEALKVAQQGQSSLAEDAATAQQSLAVQFSKVREEFLTLIREIGGSATFQALAKGALSLASAMIKIADAVKDILPIVGIMAAMRGFSAARQFGAGFLGGFRNPRGNAQGGLIGAYKKGGMVDVALMPGETVVAPNEVKAVGVSRLRQLNHADKRQKFRKGGYAQVPGTGRTDSFYTQIPEGSFVIRTDATKALGGPEGVAAAGRKKFAKGGAAELPTPRRYTGEVERTNEKPPGYSIPRALKPGGLKDGKGKNRKTLLLGRNDVFDANIIRSPITLTPQEQQKYYTDKGKPVNASKRGERFEQYLVDKNKMKKALGRTSRLDGIKGNTFIEARSRTEQTPTSVILDKFAGAIVSPRSDVDKILSEQMSRKQLTAATDVFKGRVVVYEDTTPLKGPARKQKEFKDKYQKRSTPRKARAFGGLIQYLSEGDLASSKQVGFIKSLFSQYEKATGSPHPGLANFDPSSTYKSYASTLINNLKSHISQADLIKKYGLQYSSSFGDFVVQKQGPSAFPQILPLSKFAGEDEKMIGEYQKRGKLAFGSGYTQSRTPGANSATSRLKTRYGYGRRYAFGGLIQKFENGTDWPVRQVKDRKTGEYKLQRLTQAEIIKELGGGQAVMTAYGVRDSIALKKLFSSQSKLSPEDIQKREDIFKHFTSSVETAKTPSGATAVLTEAQKKAREKAREEKQAFKALPEDSKVNVASLKGKTSYKVLENEAGEKVGLEKRAIDKGTSARIQAITRKYNMAMTKEIAELIAKRAGTTATVDKKTLKAIYQNMTRSQAEGTAFESALAAAGAGVQPKGQRPIDYQGGLTPQLSKLFGFKEDRPTEVKSSTLKGSGERRKKQYFEGVKKARLGRAAGGEVPIMAQAGEYVINRASAQAIGYQNLDDLNRYHDGGRVQFLRGGKQAKRRKGPQAKRGDYLSSTTGSLFKQKRGSGATGLGVPPIPASPAVAPALDKAKNQRTPPSSTKPKKGPGDISKASDPDAIAARERKRAEQQSESRTRKIEKFSPYANQIFASPEKKATDRLARRAAERGVSMSTRTAGLGWSRNLAVRTGTQRTVTEGLAGLDRTSEQAKTRQEQGQRRREKVQRGKNKVIDYGRNLERKGYQALNSNKSGQGLGQSLLQNTKGLGLKGAGSVITSVGKMGKALTNTAADLGKFGKSSLAAVKNMTSLTTIGGKLNYGYNNYLNNITKASSVTGKLQAAFNPVTSKFKTLTQAATTAASKLGLVKPGAGGGMAMAGGVATGGGAAGSVGVPGAFGFPKTGTNPASKQNKGIGGLFRKGKAALGGMFGGGGMGGGMMLGMAAPMIADMFTVEDPQSAGQASQSAMASTIGGGLGAAAMIGSMGPVGAVAGVGIAAVSIVKAFDDAAAAAKKFQINKLQEKIETGGEKISQVLSEIGDTAAATPEQLTKLNQALETSINSALEAGALSSNKEAGFMQKGIEGAFGMFGIGSDPEQSRTRAAIYEKSGFMGLASSIIGGQSTTDRQFKEIAPSLAKEDAQIFKAAADQAKQVMTASIMSGKSIDDILNSPEWNKQAEVLARSNAVVQEQILLVQNNSRLNDQEKKKKIDNIVAIEAESQARKLAKQVQLQKDLRDLQKAVRQTAFSFTRVMQNMENAIVSSTQKLNQLDNSLELASASASGQAKIGGANSTGVDELINVLKNPKAFSAQERQQAFGAAAGTFGSQSGNIEKVLNAGANIEDTVLQTINKTLANTGAGATDEAVIGQVNRAVKAQLAGLELPPQLADKLSSQVSKAVSNLRSSGEDTINLNALTEEVPLLAESVKIFKDVTDGAARSLEFQKSAFDRLANATNQQVELQSEANSRLRTAQTLIAKGNIDIKRALGYQPSAQEQYAAATAPVRSMTGGTIDPTQIANQFRNLEQQREQLQQGRDEATKTGDFDAVRDFDSKLKDTTLSLRENSAALKTMADSSELASIAMGEIERVQKKMQAGASIIEKLVTSSPKELATMNKAFMRLNNNMRGITNMGGTAEDRKASLDVFQMIAPLLGNQEGELRANVLQSMLAESGISVGPMMQQVLDTMRNPQSNPELMAATEQYRQATSIQAQANEELAKINQNLAADIGDKTAEAVKTALKDVTLKFDSQMLSDAFKGINTVPTQNNAQGGLIYRAVGGNVDRTVFKPKGTDTVPAMLTPGEFVVNRAATQANLPLLQSINKGGRGYQRGGRVKYYNQGGVVANNFSKDLEGGYSKVSNADDLPIFDGAILNTEDEIFLKYTRANVFPSYSSADKNEALKDFIAEVYDKGEGSGTWLPFLSRDPGEWISAVKSSGKVDVNQLLHLNKDAEIMAGLAPMSNRSGALKSSFYDGFGTIVEPKFENLDATVPTWSSVGLGKFAYEKVGELFSSTDAESFFKKGRLNNFGATTNSLPNADDVLNDPADSDASIKNQIAALTIAIARFQSMKRAADVISGKILKETDLNYDWNRAPVSTIADVYRTTNINSNQAIDDKIMMPTLTRSEADEPNNLYRGTTGNTLGGYGKGYFGTTSDGSSRTYQQKFNEIFDPQSRVSPVPPGELDAFAQNIDAMVSQIEQKKGQLENYGNDSTNFETTAQRGKAANQLNAVLSQIQGATTQGLFATIRKDDLNDEWKARVEDSLQIFPDRPGTKITDFKTRYAQQIQKDRERYQDFIDGKIYPNIAEAIKIDNKEYAWAGDYGLAERYVASFLEAEAYKAQQEYKSPFEIGDIQTASRELSFTLDKVQPGSSQKEKARFSFNYRDLVNMPRLDEKNGYAQPADNDKLTGIIASIGPASLDELVPFATADQLSGGGESGSLVYAASVDDLANRIKAGYEAYFAGDGDLAAKFKLELAKKVMGQQEGTMWIPSGADAYEKLDGESELPVFNSINAFKQKLLGRGAEAQIVEGAGLDLSGEALGIGQQLVNSLIKPNAILFRNFGLGALANLQAKEQLEPYGQALLQGQQMLGNRIINPRTGQPLSPQLATAWGNLGAVGEILTLLSKGKTGTVNAKLGLGVAQQGGGIGNGDLVGATRKYSQYLVDSALAVLGAGGGAALANAAGQAVDANTEIEIAGGRKSIQDIFKQVEENSAQSNGALQGNESTPPKSLKDLGMKLFNPYNVFQPGTRPALIDFLVTEMSKFAPGMGNPSTPFRKAIDTTKEQFKVQDDFYATPEAAKEAKVNQNIEQANKSLLLLTGGVFGLFPDANRIRGIKNLKSEARNQEQEEEQLGSTGTATTASRGGIIYASNGALVNYQPKGTDTVPAMLTPGEFVVNRRSTQANLPLLKAINSGGANGMSLGGIVNYLNNGGYITPKYYATAGTVSGGNAASGMGAIPVDAKGAVKTLSDGLVQGMQLASQTLQNTLQSFGLDSTQINAINGFVNGLKSVTDALAGINITPEVKFTGTVDVNVNGVQGMTSSMQGVVNEAIKKAMTTLKQDNQALDIDTSKY